MPGKMGPLLRKRAMRLSRISSLTRRLRTCCSENCELLRSSPRVCGSLLKGWIPPGSRPPSSPSGHQNVLNELEPGVYRAAGHGRFEHLGVDIQERRLSENRGRFVNVIIVIIGERAQWLIAFLHRDRRRCGQDLPQQIERAGEVGPMRESSVPLRGGPKNRGGSIEGDTDAPPPACSRRAGGVSPRVRL